MSLVSLITDIYAIFRNITQPSAGQAHSTWMLQQEVCTFFIKIL